MKIKIPHCQSAWFSVEETLWHIAKDAVDNGSVWIAIDDAVEHIVFSLVLDVCCEI